MFSANHKEKGCCGNASTEFAHKAGHKLREALDTATDETRDVTAAMMKEARKHPVKTGAIAAGAGFLLGLFLRRR